MRWKTWEPALAAALILALLWQIAGPAPALESKLTRLHVLAASDGDQDQQAKLLVRDAVLEAAAGAERADRQLLARMTDAAHEALRREGEDRPVAVTLERYYFDTRHYPTFTLPAGVYPAVRVVIGEGEGRNWWCVLFPPLCRGVCQEELERYAREGGLTDEEIGLICGEEEYRIRFRVIDLWNRLLHKLGQI